MNSFVTKVQAVCGMGMGLNSIPYTCSLCKASS